MILGDVLRVLSTYCNAFGIDHNDLYMLLFEEEDLNLEQTVKNTFGKRGLNQKIYKELIKDEGFLHLAEIIDTRLLSVLGSHRDIYRDLYALVENDTHFSDSDKRQILSSFDPDDQKQLAQLIALCIICGNYNLPRRKSKQPKNQTTYGINLNTFTANPEGSFLEHDLWKASQRDFFASRRRGGRFSSFHIITQLLPKGFIAEPDFLIKGKTENNSVKSVMDLCAEGHAHIAVIGNGGIGKTTFLHQLMSESYAKKELSDTGETILKPLPYQTGKPIPFFIELNRCPESIGSWYDDNLRKTNFITRYIAQILENHASLDSVDPKTLDSIEKDFQKTPANGIPRYLLLLDGFNEVKSSQGHSIRTFLSNEISVLSQYPNVRIITTSRETQAAYYASAFENIRLIGLEDEDIVAYLRKCRIPETKIGLIMACQPLVECLRIPLYICMFCAEDSGAALPETPGEILYNFFHRNSSFYNIRSRAKDTRTNPLEPRQTAFVLDFILPYIGWQMETDDCFSVNETAFRELIRTAIFSISSFCSTVSVVPFSDFHYRPMEVLETAESFLSGDSDSPAGKEMMQKILDCLYSYLGIIYQYQTAGGPFAERNRYAFSHHQFRDYFSAMWDIQQLELTQCMDPQCFFQNHLWKKQELSCAFFLNTRYWQHHKTEFISQILMERKNRPRLHSATQNWYLPKTENDEQQILTNVLSFCRHIEDRDIHYLLQNILSAILSGRKELSGVDLSDLNLTGCSFFNVTCSRKGKSSTLAANFQNSILDSQSFEPESHQNNVIDHLYHGNHCFTLDDDGRLKCWDILSGKMEYEYQFPDPTGIWDFSSSGFLKISPDGKWLATKIQESHADGIMIGIQLLNLNIPKRQLSQFLLEDPDAKTVNYFTFTGDSKGILFLVDYKTICCFSLDNRETVYTFSCPDLMKDSQIYAETTASPIYAFTAEYDLYNGLEEYSEMDEWDLEDEGDGEGDDAGVPCRICRLDPESKHLEVLHSCISTPGSKPTAAYLPQKNAFLVYDYDAEAIIFFDCSSQDAFRVLPELIQENRCQPSYIHLHPGNPEECYIMYPDTCYLIDMQDPKNMTVLMKYPISGLHKLLKGSDQEGELYFKTEVVPDRNRFIVSNDTTTYEWNSEEDTLIPRYNLLYYSCSGLIGDTGHRQFLLVHMHNGVSVFSGAPAALKNAFCFEDPDYYISSCSFHSPRQLLALAFSRSDHEKVRILDLTDSNEETVFSTMHPHETIENLCWSTDGKHLLISTSYQCCEYAPDEKKLSVVRTAGEGERIAGADYQGKVIEVTVIQNHQEQETHVEDRCEYFQRRKLRGDFTYRQNGYYLLPELTDDLMPYFIFQHGDLGVQGSVDRNGKQAYWITSGFFLPSSTGLFSLPKVNACSANGKKTTYEILPCQHMYFKHQKALEYQYREKNAGFSYTFLDDASGKAIFMQNSESIFYHDHYTKCTYEELQEGLSKNMGSYGGKAYWDYAVPYQKNQMIVCYENYQLMALDTENGEEQYQIPYTPGLSIFGCNFRNAKADQTLLEQLRTNGGIVSE